MAIKYVKKAPKTASTDDATTREIVQKLLKDLDNLTSTIKKDLNKNASFVVFHDAYQYFEKRFGLSVIGALTVNPDVMPGAEQLSEIREVIEEKKVKCIFSEPQFNQR